MLHIYGVTIDSVQHQRLVTSAEFCNLSTSVFECDSAINYTLVTAMQQLSTKTLYKHNTGSGSFSESCFFHERQKTISSCTDPHVSNKQPCRVPHAEEKNAASSEVLNVLLLLFSWPSSSQVLEKWLQVDI